MTLRRALLLMGMMLGGSLRPLLADAVFVSSTNSVSQYDVNGNFVQQLALPVSPSIGDGVGGFVNPTGIAIGSDGSVYVADYQANTSSLAGVIYHFSSSGQYLGVFTSGSSLSEPQGIAFGQNGDLYVTNYNFNNSYLSAYDSAGNPVTLTGSGAPALGLGLGAPAGGIAFGTNGDLYIPDPFNGVDQYGADGGFLQSFGFPSPVSNPSAIAVDASGNVFVADVGAGEIFEFDSSGNLIATLNPFNPLLGGNGWAQPTSLAFGPGGTLFVGDDFGITEVNAGTVSTFNFPLASPEFLAYDATVPEPGLAWVCGLGGLAVLLGWRRRASRS